MELKKKSVPAVRGSISPFGGFAVNDEQTNPRTTRLSVKRQSLLGEKERRIEDRANSSEQQNQSACFATK
jgi:hypothetical protein